MANSNLLVTYEPSHQGSAKSVVESLLKQVKQPCQFLKSDIDGLFQLRVKNPLKAIAALMPLAKKKPSMFERTYHWVPVQKWCSSSLKTIQKEMKKIDKKIKEKEKWKMSLAKRDYGMGEHELVMKLTEMIDKPNVDLEKPDKIIRVEIVGKKAGLSLLGKNEMLNIHDYLT